MQLSTPVFTVEEAVRHLISLRGTGSPLFNIKPAGDGPVPVLNGDVPLFYWRKHPRLRGMKAVITAGRIEGICALRFQVIERNNTSLRNIVYRELDICRWLTGCRINGLYAVSHGERAMHLVVWPEGGAVCTIEIFTGLDDGEQPVRKHEIIARRGTVMDIAVDTQSVADSIYLWSGDRFETYSDPDLELFGMEYDHILTVHSAMDVLTGTTDAQILIKEGRELTAAADAALKSSAAGEKLTADGILAR